MWGCGVRDPASTSGAMKPLSAWDLPFPKFVPGNRPILPSPPPSLPCLGTGAASADFCPFTMGFSHGNRGLERRDHSRSSIPILSIWGSHALGDGEGG